MMVSSMDKLYHFTNAEYLISSIQKNRLKLSTFHNLNDPYEVMPFSKSESGDYAPAVLVRKHIQDMLKNTGLFCMSSNVESTLMWGHYADRHRGVAYEFHFEQEIENVLFHVEYNNERVEYSDKTDLDNEKKEREFFTKLLQRKAECWRYEAEYRWVFPLKNPHVEIFVDHCGLIFMRFSKEQLKRIILGVDCPLLEGVVSSALEKEGLLDIAVTRAKLSDGDYRVIVDPIEEQRGKRPA